LEREASYWIEGLGRKMRPNDEIGEQRKRFADAPEPDRGCADRNVHRSGRNRTLDTRAIERVGELLTVAAARAALREFGEQTRPTIAMLAIGIGSIAAGRSQLTAAVRNSAISSTRSGIPQRKHADVNRILARNRGHRRDAIRPNRPALAAPCNCFKPERPAGCTVPPWSTSRYRPKWHPN
jgi:hypothetical protein